MESEVTAIDRSAHYAFIHKIKRIIPMPEVILEEYRRQGRLAEPAPVVTYHPPPFEQYRRAEGYVFSWGHIVERRIERVIAWDFCFDRLLERYHRSRVGLNELQRQMFGELVRQIPQQVEADYLYLAGMEAGWRVYPGTAIGGFAVVANFYSEEDARTWIIDSLIPHVLPCVLQAACSYIEHVEADAQ